MTGFVWNGRYDSDQQDDLRLFQVVEQSPVTRLPNLQTDQQGYALVGFESDEGVKRNQGRQGAVDGPDCIRAALANLPYHAPPLGQAYRLCDTGNVSCQGENLAHAQQDLSCHIAEAMSYRRIAHVSA